MAGADSGVFFSNVMITIPTLRDMVVVIIEALWPPSSNHCKKEAVKETMDPFTVEKADIGVNC